MGWESYKKWSWLDNRNSFYKRLNNRYFWLFLETILFFEAKYQEIKFTKSKFVISLINVEILKKKFGPKKISEILLHKTQKYHIFEKS